MSFQISRKHLLPTFLATSFAVLFLANIAHARTIVVHLSTYDTEKTTNALLFSKHSCQFLPDAEDTTIRVVLTNDAVLNTIKSIKHAKNRGETLPDDDPKTANHLIRQLLSLAESEPALRCNLQMAVTGPGLKRIGKTPADMYKGIKVGGAKPTDDPAKVQMPVFMTTPEVAGEDIVVVDW